jgi:hypothetical protein
MQGHASAYDLHDTRGGSRGDAASPDSCACAEFVHVARPHCSASSVSSQNSEPAEVNKRTLADCAQSAGADPAQCHQPAPAVSSQKPTTCKHSVPDCVHIVLRCCLRTASHVGRRACNVLNATVCLVASRPFASAAVAAAVAAALLPLLCSMWGLRGAMHPAHVPRSAAAPASHPLRGSGWLPLEDGCLMNLDLCPTCAPAFDEAAAALLKNLLLAQGMLHASLSRVQRIDQDLAVSMRQLGTFCGSVQSALCTCLQCPSLRLLHLLAMHEAYKLCKRLWSSSADTYVALCGVLNRSLAGADMTDQFAHGSAWQMRAVLSSVQQQIDTYISAHMPSGCSKLCYGCVSYAIEDHVPGVHRWLASSSGGVDAWVCCCSSSAEKLAWYQLTPPFDSTQWAAWDAEKVSAADQARHHTQHLL